MGSLIKEATAGSGQIQHPWAHLANLTHCLSGGRRDLKAIIRFLDGVLDAFSEQTDECAHFHADALRRLAEVLKEVIPSAVTAAKNDDDKESRDGCDTCIQAEANGMRDRLRRHAEDLRVLSQKLDGLANESIEGLLEEVEAAHRQAVWEDRCGGSDSSESVDADSV